jgi:ribosomal protein S18 acetylase RimI-like enzyme
VATVHLHDAVAAARAGYAGEPPPCHASPTSRSALRCPRTKGSSSASRDPSQTMRSVLAARDAWVLIAEQDSAPLGFVALQLEPLGRDFGPWTSPAAARIEAIAVRSDAQGRGIGRRLVRHAELAARAHGARSLSLATAEKNARARRLFDAAGFMSLTVVEAYYTRGQAAVLMLKALA